MISQNIFQAVTFFYQGIKAQAFENVKSSEDASETFYTEEEESCDDEINKYTTTAEILTQLAETFATYKETQMGNDNEQQVHWIQKQILMT